MSEHFEMQGQEYLEAMGIQEEQTEHGFRQVNAEGQEILRTETYGNTQTTQFEYPKTGGSIENAKVIEGEKLGQEYKREHPGTTHEVSLNLPDLGEVQASATLETLGQTVTNSPDGSNQPWAHFSVEDSTALEAFNRIPNNQRQAKGEGTEAYAVLNGSFGGGFALEVNGRQVQIDQIGRISIDYGPDGKARKVTLHKIMWSKA